MEKIKFLANYELFMLALEAASKFDEEARWLLEVQPGQTHPEYEQWYVAVKRHITKLVF